MEISNIAVLIPARKGSKRLSNKNIKMLNGKPLLQYTFDAALKSLATNIFFTTDYLKSDIPFFPSSGITWISRPKEAALDNAPAIDYVGHFFDRYPTFQAVMILQPTSPLRTFEDINSALKLYKSSIKPTLVSAYRIDGRAKLYTKEGKSTQKQFEYYNFEDKFLYYRNSSIYICSKKHFLRYKSIFSESPIIYEMPLARSIDINSIDDFRLAERIMK